MLHIACVISADISADDIIESEREEGDWASFVGENKQEVIEAAIEARDKWQAKDYGPYDIYLGVLTACLQTPKIKYKEVKIATKDRTEVRPDNHRTVGWKLRKSVHTNRSNRRRKGV